ncbi:hypothetical protein D9615_000437 [Tricholomella constricta]|uniref:Uncharacterized protein n=1 Tax=Tricholomella constricta TaxID=117010 RepID=A0A8H5MBC6_9AGAR|nr:hypothetical protein D9615_000437 [Tricholomella constricta]
MLVPLFYTLLLSSPASASPAHLLDTPGGSACLAVLLTLFSLLSFLLICKRIFLKTRNSKSLTEPLAANSSARSSTPIAYSSTTKAAFFVGFFGSPAWETSLTNIIDTSRCIEDKQSSLSYSYQVYTGSRRSKSSRTPHSSVTDEESLPNHAKFRSLSVSAVGDIRVFFEKRDATGLERQRKSRSLRLPARPSKAYTGLPAVAVQRRFSMPSAVCQRPRDVNNVGHRKRASSLKTTMTKRSDVSSSSFPGNSSLRLVKSIDGPDYPLPLSSEQQEHHLSTNQDSFAAPVSVSNYDYAFVPPLPVLRRTSTQPDSALQSKNALRISHPYSLTKVSAPSSESSKAASDPDRSPPYPISKANQQVPVNRKPLSPLPNSFNLSPLSVPCPAAIYPFDPASVPYPPLEKAVISPKLKQKARRPSIRVRRSPAIGPSPLRTMILPDPSDSNMTARTNVSELRSRNSNTSLDHSRIGLGFPKTPYTDAQELKPIESSEAQEQEQNRNGRASGTTAGDDPNVLMGIIRELVEETNQWDGSLFKDKNFKTMIENSKYPSFKGSQTRGTIVKEQFSRVSEDKSAEFDLSLLGLDIFRSGGETFIPGTEDKTHLNEGEGADLVSFWRDGGGHSDQDAKREVGVAC